MLEYQTGRALKDHLIQFFHYTNEKILTKRNTVSCPNLHRYLRHSIDTFFLEICANSSTPIPHQILVILLLGPPLQRDYKGAACRVERVTWESCGFFNFSLHKESWQSQ